jgi:hypothetical protein
MIVPPGMIALQCKSKATAAAVSAIITKTLAAQLIDFIVFLPWGFVVAPHSRGHSAARDYVRKQVN